MQKAARLPIKKPSPLEGAMSIEPSYVIDIVETENLHTTL
jgi:hypothetical protein